MPPLIGAQMRQDLPLQNLSMKELMDRKKTLTMQLRILTEQYLKISDKMEEVSGKIAKNAEKMEELKAYQLEKKATMTQQQYRQYLQMKHTAYKAYDDLE